MVNYYLYKTGQFIALKFPLKLGYRIATFFSDLHYLVADKDRLIVKNNLKIIFPEKTESEICRMRIRLFRNFAKYLVDFFRFEKLDIEFIKKNIRIENRNYVDEALSKGKGVIFVTAHLGNWELGGVVVALSGYPFLVVALPHKDKKIDDFFNAQRESKGVKVVPLGRAVRACINFLKENKIIALAADRDFSGTGAITTFFGKDSYFPEGPAALSCKTGAPVIPGFMLRNPDDTFTLRFEKAIECPLQNSKEKTEEEIISRYKTIFEDYIRKYPDQWYMFRQFWI